MADSEVPDLTAIDAVAAGDLFYIVDDPGGTPLDRKATAAQIKTFVETGRFVATAANPMVNDDSGDGYVAGTVWLNTTTGQVYRARDVSVGAAAWLPFDSADHFGYISGNWCFSEDGAPLAAGSALVASNIRLLPIVIKWRTTLSTIGARIATLAVAGNIQFALYANNPATGRPTGNALAVTGSISTTSSGLITADITGADVVFEPGLYWMAVNADATAGATCIMQTYANTAGWMSWLIGSATHANINTGNTASRLGLLVSHTFGTWPDLTAGSFTESTNTADAILQFKVA